MKGSVFCSGIIAALIVTGCGEPAKKPVSAAAIVSLNGSVMVDSRPGRTGEKLQRDSVITVGADSQCLLAVVRGDSGLRLRLGPGSTFELRQALDTPLNVVGTLKAGGGVFDLENAGAGDAVKVVTPTTVAAVRGTKFSVAVQDDATEVKVAQGQVAMRPRIEAIDSVDPDMIAASGSLKGVIEAADQGATGVAAGQAGRITAAQAQTYNENLPAEVKELQKSPLLRETDSGKAAAEIDKKKAELEKGLEAMPALTRDAAPQPVPVKIDANDFQMGDETEKPAQPSVLEEPARQPAARPVVPPPVAPAIPAPAAPEPAVPAAVAASTPGAADLKLGNEAPREEDFQKLQEVSSPSENTVQSFGDTVELNSGKRYENVGTLISKDFVVIIGSDGRRLAEVSKREVKSISKGGR